LPCANPTLAVPFYRVYASVPLYDHFYTTNATERTIAINNLGYTNDEGIEAYIFPTSEPGTIPLYRTYHPTAYDHFYTTSFSQRNGAINDLGYEDEGIAGYVYPDTSCGGTPLYRAYSGAETDHFYTTSPTEWDNSVGTGYAKEGIAGYVFAA
jgi:Repeat of unknown function (DUF5648)